MELTDLIEHGNIQVNNVWYLGTVWNKRGCVSNMYGWICGYPPPRTRCLALRGRCSRTESNFWLSETRYR
ncbi:unnamed protein product [Arctia plantaginis]|uniref:Uncharacterized protein n=1 Tax=Arctia plantaginis TaxID=874455 RepID=A0A8S0Z716_ARCPL|nr:unnamed protein product [Arctia plantaginis]